MCSAWASSMYSMFSVQRSRAGASSAIAANRAPTTTLPASRTASTMATIRTTRLLCFMG